MPSYGQFCSVARSLELIEGRWTLLVVRELLCGSRRFSEIARGIPRISRTLLSTRLLALTKADLVSRSDGEFGPEYTLTRSGEELGTVVAALGTWGQRWLPRDARAEDLDVDPLLVDMARRVHGAALPGAPFITRFEIRGHEPRFMLFKSRDAALCSANPGFPEPLIVRSSLPALVTWWRGDSTFLDAQRMGLTLTGPKTFARAFPSWFERYQFAEVRSLRG